MKMMLNGQPRELSVDTGSDISSITNEAALELGVKQFHTENGGAFLNNVTIDRYGFLDSLAFGAVHTTGKWPVLIIPDKVVPNTISGLIGANIMQPYDVELNFFRGKLNFFAPNKCPAPVYWAKAYARMAMTIDSNQHISVEAKLDGKTVTVILDTGASNSIMSLDVARDLFGWSDNDPRMKPVTEENFNGGGSADVYLFPFQSLTFEGVTVNNPKIQMVPREHFMQHDKSIVVGLNVLRQLHLLIAYPDNTLYLTPAEAEDGQIPAIPPQPTAAAKMTDAAVPIGPKTSP